MLKKANIIIANNRKNNKSNLPYKVFTTPKQFSILNNPEETIKFFNEIWRVIKNITSIKIVGM